MNIKINIEKKQRIRKKTIREFQIVLVNWYRQNGRHLLWRETSDPYKIIVAEFLLQKTDTEKVKPVYKKFINRWPSPQVLLKTRISSISKMIETLGLKYKASRLKSTVEMIVKNFNGKIPETNNELLKLPGVGRYISSAIECFILNKPKAILDTNIVRILSRVFGIQSDKNRPRDDPYLWYFAQTLVPTVDAKEYNWGLLDYGALVCRSKEPLCNRCVLSKMCIFYKQIKFDRINIYEKDKF